MFCKIESFTGLAFSARFLFPKIILERIEYLKDYQAWVSDRPEVSTPSCELGGTQSK